MKLSNGEELLLIEVPGSANDFHPLLLNSGWGIAYKVNGRKGRDISECKLNKRPELLGTFYKGEIDFEVPKGIVESSGEFNSTEPYLHQYKDYINEIDYDLDEYGSFISLLKSMTEKDKKYVVLIIKPLK